MNRVTPPPAIQFHTALASKRGSISQVAPNVGVGRDHALWSAGRAAGIENHGAPLVSDVRQVGGLAKGKLVI